MTGATNSRGVALVVLGAGCFTLNAGVSRVALRAGIDPALLTTIRVSCTFVVLLAIAACWRRTALRPPRGRLLGLVLAHGLIGVAALQWTYFVAIDRLPIGMALLLEYQAPILVALWARLVQKHPVRRTLWLGLALALIGLAAATQVWHGARPDPVGVAAGLGAALCFAAYFLIGEAAVSAHDPLRVILWSFGVAAIALNVITPIGAVPISRLDDPVPLLGALDAVHLPLGVILAWIILGGTVLPFFAELFALAFVRATTVTTIAMLEPIGVSALGWAWFGESLGVIPILGCLLVVAGILVSLGARLEPAQAAESPLLSPPT